MDTTEQRDRRRTVRERREAARVARDDFLRNEDEEDADDGDDGGRADGRAELMKMYGIHARVSDLNAGYKFKWVDTNNEYTWALHSQEADENGHIRATIRRRSDMQKAMGCDGCAVSHYMGTRDRKISQTSHCSATTGYDRMEEYRDGLRPGEFILVPLGARGRPVDGVWQIIEFIDETHRYKTCDVVCERTD
jgi:hypothetical protein